MWEPLKGNIFTALNTTETFHFWCKASLFFIWAGITDELGKFYKYINNAHKSLEFTKEHSKNKNKFTKMASLKLFSKRKLTFIIWPFKTQQDNSIAYSKVFRIRRVYSNDELLRKSINLCTKYFVYFQYSRNSLKPQHKRI